MNEKTVALEKYFQAVKNRIATNQQANEYARIDLAASDAFEKARTDLAKAYGFKQGGPAKLIRLPEKNKVLRISDAVFCGIQVDVEEITE